MLMMVGSGLSHNVHLVLLLGLLGILSGVGLLGLLEDLEVLVEDVAHVARRPLHEPLTVKLAYLHSGNRELLEELLEKVRVVGEELFERPPEPRADVTDRPSARRGWDACGG